MDEFEREKKRLKRRAEVGARKGKTAAWGTGVIAAAVIVAVVAALIVFWPRSDKKEEAWQAAQRFVEEQLTSPASVNYGPQRAQDVVEERGDDGFLVRGWVDSENVAGATVRREFRVWVKPGPAGEWECSSVDVWLPAARRIEHRTKCLNNLRTIAIAVQTWSLQYGESGLKYPPSLRSVYDDGQAKLPVFVCPASDTKVTPGHFVSDYESILDLADSQLTTLMVPDSRVLLAWDNTAGRHGGVCVVYFDGHPEFIKGDDKEAAMAKVRRKVNKWLRTFQENQQDD